jgi:hypothetical protein
MIMTPEGLAGNAALKRSRGLDLLHTWLEEFDYGKHGSLGESTVLSVANGLRLNKTIRRFCSSRILLEVEIGRRL